MDGRPPESDLLSLQSSLDKKEEEFQRCIDDNVIRHQNWNKGWVDITWRPITPPLEDRTKSNFRTAITEYLPTPPLSATSEQSIEIVHADEELPKLNKDSALVQSDPFRRSDPGLVQPSFRRRVGRGGRLMIDRRGIVPTAPREVDERVFDRYKYDADSDEDDEVYSIDYFRDFSIKYRVLLNTPSREPPLQPGEQPQPTMAQSPLAARARTLSGTQPSIQKQ